MIRHQTSTLPRSAACVALLGVVSGCTGRLDTPAGYAALREPAPYEYKAVSPRGVAIALSSRPNDDGQADLAFWSEAVEYQKVQLDGLKLARRDALTANSGLNGTLFEFEEGSGQGKLCYLVALYVTPQKITTVEAAGPAALVAADRDKLVAAMKTAR